MLLHIYAYVYVCMYIMYSVERQTWKQIIFKRYLCKQQIFFKRYLYKTIVLGFFFYKILVTRYTMLPISFYK